MLFYTCVFNVIYCRLLSDWLVAVKWKQKHFSVNEKKKKKNVYFKEHSTVKLKSSFCWLISFLPLTLYVQMKEHISNVLVHTKVLWLHCSETEIICSLSRFNYKITKLLPVRAVWVSASCSEKSGLCSHFYYHDWSTSSLVKQS